MPPRPSAVGTKVLTDFGLAEIQDLAIGDFVYTHKGRLRRVKNIINAGILPVKTIKLVTGQSTIAAYTHPFLNYNFNDNFYWKEVKDLTVNDFLAYWTGNLEKPFKYSKIANILEEGRRPCICLEVEEDCSYIADGIISHNSGKPLANGTLVLKADGTNVPIEELKINDYLITHLKNYKRVLKIENQGILPCLCIKTASGRSIETAYDHPFLTPAGWKYAKDLIVGDCLANLDQYTLKEKNTRTIEEFRLAGYFLGDGGIGYSSCGTGLNSKIKNSNDDILSEIIDCVTKLGFEYGIRYKKGSLINRDIELKNGIRDWQRCSELAYKTSYTKVIPTWVYEGDNSKIAVLLASYFMCDGTVTKKWSGKRYYGAVEYYSVSRKLLEGVQHLLLRLGIQSSLRLKNGQYKGKRHISYRLIISGKDSIARFVNKIPIISYKKELLKDLESVRKEFNNLYFPDCIEAIEKIDDKNCICIQVEDDESFIANDFVVHNSELISKTFPAWYLGTFPDKRIILTSYESSFAAEWGAYARDLFEEFGEEVFGLKVRSDVSSAKRWGIEGHTGYMMTAGALGPITGKGADCLPAGTMIYTENGIIPIEKLVKSVAKPRVLSYNHQKNVVEFKKIIHTREIEKDDIYEVTTSSGNKIRATGQHLFYVPERGYTEARLLTNGDRLLICKVKKECNLPSLWQEKKWAWGCLSQVLSRNAKSLCDTCMSLVSSRIRETFVRIRKGNEEKGGFGFLLFFKLFQRASQYKECRDVRLLRKAYAKEKRCAFLFHRMSQEWKRQNKIRKNSLPNVYNYFQTVVSSNKILFQKMCRQCSFPKNVRAGKFTLPRRKQLCSLVSADASFDIGERQLSLCDLRNGGTIFTSFDKKKDNISVEFSSTSYRRECEKQYSRKSRNFVQDVSCGTPQIEYESVAMVRRICDRPIKVYDLQVEGNCNFFANNVLVHNCFIIDDPIKGAEDAASITMREKLWQWYGSVAYTRLQPGGSLIIIQTRWHCLTHNNLIYSENRLRPIFCVKAQENILTSQGPSNIIATATKPYKGLVIQIQSHANYRPLEVTPEHTLLTQRGWVKAEEIVEDDFLFCPKDKSLTCMDKVKFLWPEFRDYFVENRSFWRLIGYWLSGVLEDLNPGDLTEVIHLCDENKINFTYKLNSNYNTVINLDHPALYHLLTPFGYAEGVKRIPERVFHLPEAHIKELLYGVWKGKGSRISDDEGSVSLSNMLHIKDDNEDLLYGLQRLLIKIDCPAYIRLFTEHKNNRCLTFHASVFDPQYKEDPTETQRRYQYIDDRLYFKVKKVRRTFFDGLVYDLKTLSGEFLVGSTVVSNCDDLTGRLLATQEQGGEKWEHLNFPAIATKDELPWPKGLGRKKGEALWPEMWPLEALNRIKNSGGVSPYQWSSLYQQQPTPEGGGVFKKEWFRYFTFRGNYYAMDTGNGIVFCPCDKCWYFVTIDTANKTQEHNDYTAIAVWAVTLQNDLLLVDLRRDRYEYQVILSLMQDVAAVHRPRYIGIENTGIGIAIINETRCRGLPVRALEPMGQGKQNRADMPFGAVVRMEGGKIYFPKEAPYLNDLENELLTFPKGEHDEIVDCLSYACNELTKMDTYQGTDFAPYTLNEPLGIRKKGTRLFDL